MSGGKNCNNDDEIRCHAHAERGGRRRLDTLTAGTRNDNIIIHTTTVTYYYIFYYYYNIVQISITAFYRPSVFAPSTSSPPLWVAVHTVVQTSGLLYFFSFFSNYYYYYYYYYCHYFYLFVVCRLTWALALLLYQHAIVSRTPFDRDTCARRFLKSLLYAITSSCYYINMTNSNISYCIMICDVVNLFISVECCVSGGLLFSISAKSDV